MLQQQFKNKVTKLQTVFCFIIEVELHTFLELQRQSNMSTMLKLAHVWCKFKEILNFHNFYPKFQIYIDKQARLYS